MDTAVVTALADNSVGRLVEDLMFQGGVSQKYVRWVDFDGVGRTVRNGLNFTERGFGLRAPLGCSDRGHTAISQLQPGEIDWEQIFQQGRNTLASHGRNLLRVVGDRTASGVGSHGSGEARRSDHFL